MAVPLAIAGASAALSIYGNIQGRKKQNRAIISSIEQKGRALVSDVKIANENINQIERNLGNTLSANALQSAKLVAQSRALAASSGTAGGTTETTSKQSYIDQTIADAEAIFQKRNQEVEQLRSQLVSRISFKNEADALRSQIPSTTEAIFSMIGAGLSGAQQGVNMLSATQKMDMFGKTPSTNKS